LSSEYIHRNLSAAQYALQNLEPYKALIIETKRNQKLYEFKFQIEGQSSHMNVETLESPDVLSDQMDLDPHQGKETSSCKSEMSVDIPDNDKMV
jgi:hypothetical protein